MNMNAIFAVMNATRAVVKIRPEKNSGLHGMLFMYVKGIRIYYLAPCLSGHYHLLLQV